MILRYASFQSNPPDFTLEGITRGGPPTNYIWTRDGEVIVRSEDAYKTCTIPTRNGLYSISNGTYSMTLRVTSRYQINREESGYTSSLYIIGDLPGVYEYTVSNRAMESSRTASFRIEGKYYEVPFVSKVIFLCLLYLPCS